MLSTFSVINLKDKNAHKTIFLSKVDLNSQHV